jgi:hypothetical protein
VIVVPDPEGGLLLAWSETDWPRYRIRAVERHGKPGVMLTRQAERGRGWGPGTFIPTDLMVHILREIPTEPPALKSVFDEASVGEPDPRVTEPRSEFMEVTPDEDLVRRVGRAWGNEVSLGSYAVGRMIVHPGQSGWREQDYTYIATARPERLTEAELLFRDQTCRARLAFGEIARDNVLNGITTAVVRLLRDRAV